MSVGGSHTFTGQEYGRTPVLNDQLIVQPAFFRQNTDTKDNEQEHSMRLEMKLQSVIRLGDFEAVRKNHS